VTAGPTDSDSDRMPRRNSTRVGTVTSIVVETADVQPRPDLNRPCHPPSAKEVDVRKYTEYSVLVDRSNGLNSGSTGSGVPVLCCGQLATGLKGSGHARASLGSSQRSTGFLAKFYTKARCARRGPCDTLQVVSRTATAIAAGGGGWSEGECHQIGESAVAQIRVGCRQCAHQSLCAELCHWPFG
jgi:hypothetical protein